MPCWRQRRATHNNVRAQLRDTMMMHFSGPCGTLETCSDSQCSTTHWKKVMSDPSNTKFLVVRNPLDRLLSGVRAPLS